jgi:signal peptidase
VGCELAAEVIRSFGSLRLRVVGTSMLPVLWPGDILLVHRHNPTEVNPGDVVVFRHGRRLVTHRVVHRTPCQKPIQWVTRGDRLKYDDAPVSSHELLGRVVSIQRGSRRLSPHLTFWNKIGSSILSRSEFCTRLLLRLRRIAMWGAGLTSGLDIRDSARVA